MRHLQYLAILIACMLVSAARAQFPDRPIHMIVPQAAGSATDTVARILAASLGEQIGQQVIIDDRPGGALTVGLDLT
ncbi:MAG TPA: tripartite tricarboxylate transporter substrate binding protein, partial [Stellaceae bacterium]|nr:tripartite tricarboxylate transporter substrate binding protein [Stellaceae bacterium]